MTPRDTVRARLMEYLEAERIRCLELAVSLKTPPSVAVSDWVATSVTDTGAQYSERVRFVSPLASFDAGSGLMRAAFTAGGMTPPPVALHDHYGQRCNIWLGRTFDDTAGEVSQQAATELIVRTARAYVSQLVSLAEADPTLAESLVDGLLELIEGEGVRFVTALAVGGIRLTVESLDCDGVTVRRLTSEELGRLSQTPVEIQPPFRAQRVSLSVTVSLERCALIVRTNQPKTAQPHGYRAHALVLALQLLGFDLRGSGDAATYTEPGPSLYSGGQHIPLQSHSGAIRDCTAEDLASAVALAALVPDETFRPATRSKAIALQRFRTAVCERFPADAIIDFVTALEALLLQQDSQELSFKLALYGARYLCDSAQDRRLAFGELKKLYDMRSGLVHGSRGWGDAQRLAAMRSTARDYTGRLLVKALREGWPTREHLRDLTLS